MSGLPAPMTPADCDLRGFMEWTRFFGEKAFKSHWYRAALKDPRGGLAAIKLWWAAMLECPAGSLPNDEEELCWLADFGQDIRSWRKHRAAAMHGFVLCADNRWYHPFLAEEANRAWELRRDKAHERDVWREQKRRQRANHTNGEALNVQVDIDRCPPGHSGGQDGGHSPMSAETSASRAGLDEKEKRREERGPPKSPTPDGVGEPPPLRGRDPHAPDGFGQKRGTRADGTNPRATSANPRNRPKIIPFTRPMSGTLQAVLEDGFETLASDEADCQADEDMRATVTAALRLR